MVSLLWMFCTPCNHLGGFQDLSAPRVILQSWLWDPGMYPSLAGSCCCWLDKHGTERKSTLTLGSQRNLSFLALEQSSGMQGDGLIDVISVESWMKDGVFGHGVFIGLSLQRYLLFIEFIPHGELGQTNPVPLHVLFCLMSFNFSNVPAKGWL